MLIAYVNGEFVNAAHAAVNLEDRGYQYGDGIYEMVRVYQGKPWLWEPHLERLYLSGKRIGMDVPWTGQELLDIYKILQEKNNFPESSLYIQVSRGVAPRKHWVTESMSPSLVMMLRAADRPPQEVRDLGVKGITVPDDRWGRCHIKSLNLLPNVLAKRAAVEQDAFEAIYYLEDGTVTEATASNVFAVKDSVLWTHPEHPKILSGITRRKVLEIARSLNIETKEAAFTKDWMAGADEVFVTATVIEMVPIVTLDGNPVGTGQVGPVFGELYKQYYNQLLVASR